MTDSKDITGNIGEWSELYTLLKILSDGHLQAGQADLQANQASPLPVLLASRVHSDKETLYHIGSDEISIASPGGQSSLSRAACTEWAATLLGELKLHAKTKGSRSIPLAKQWMKALSTDHLKAQSNDKTDIQLVLHDIQTGIAPKLGFSIKSRLGSPSTLFNANKDATNAVFEIKHVDASAMNAFNNASNFKNGFAALPNQYVLEFKHYAKSVFHNNLRIVDGELPSIVAYLIEFYYRGVCSPKISDLTAAIEALNPLEIDLAIYPKYYSHKIKRFLVDVALGFTPAKPWMGCYDATGGYIVVKESGDLLSYHVYNRNQFENYLFCNTQLDTPSTSRHQHGNIYQENSSFLLKLNLQIRFFH